MSPKSQKKCVFWANKFCQVNAKGKNMMYYDEIEITILLFDQHHSLAQTGALNQNMMFDP